MTVVVHVREGFLNNLIGAFKSRSGISYSIRGNSLVLFFATDDLRVMINIIKEIQAMDGVLGVYPVFSGNLDEFI